MVATTRKVATITMVNALKAKESTVKTAVAAAEKVVEEVARVANTMITKSNLKILKLLVTKQRWSTKGLRLRLQLKASPPPIKQSLF